MLRRDAVGDRHRFFQIAHQDEGATIGQRGFDRLATRHGRQQLFDARLDAFDESGVGTDQDGLRQLVVFGLREKIHRNPVRIAGTVGDDEDFRGTGHHVDADDAENTTLGRRHVGIAGADDLVDLRHRLRAISQRPDRLRPAHGEYAIDAGQTGRRQHQRVLFAARRRHDHDQFLDAGHLGRNRVHQYGRRIGCLATRHVETDAIERRDHLAEHGAVGFGVGPAVELLFLVVDAHALRRRFKRGTLRGRQAVERRLHFRPRQFEIGHAARTQAIETVGALDHRGIAARLDVGQDAGDGAFDTLIGRRLEGEQRVHLCREIGVDR